MVLLFLGINVFYPAYLSHITVCTIGGKEKVEELGYILTGSININGDNYTGKLLTTEDFEKVNDSDIHINILESDVQTIKHELCHYYQITRRDWRFGCDNPWKHYFMEVECYTTQYLPEKIFFLIYDF